MRDAVGSSGEGGRQQHGEHPTQKCATGSWQPSRQLLRAPPTHEVPAVVDEVVVDGLGHACGFEIVRHAF